MSVSDWVVSARVVFDRTMIFNNNALKISMTWRHERKEKLDLLNKSAPQKAEPKALSKLRRGQLLNSLGFIINKYVE